MDEEEQSRALRSGTSRQRYESSKLEVVLMLPPYLNDRFFLLFALACMQLCVHMPVWVRVLTMELLCCGRLVPNQMQRDALHLQLESTNKSGHNTARWAHLALNMPSPLMHFTPSVDINKHIFWSKPLPHDLVLMKYVSTAVPHK